MTRLIIAEKPDMGKKIASALAKPHKNGQGYIETQEGIVTWCIGHIMKAYDPEDYNKSWEEWKLETLPLLIDDVQLKVDSKKSSQFKIIKDLLGKCSEVIHAGDPGREGQLIVDEVLYYLKNKKPVQRILLHSLDQKSIIQAFQKLENNQKFYNLYLAAVCRSFADWEIGINATRAFTITAQKNGYKGVLSVGRVQSPTLAIVVQRDLLIENFVPHDYYVIQATFDHQNQSFLAYWKHQDITPKNLLDSENHLIDLNYAQQITQKILGKTGVVKEFKEELGKEHPPLPFNLSQLQIYANSKWGFSAKDVLDTCQSLYEHHELQTYPRTDCSYLPENQFGDAATILSHIEQSQPHLKNAIQGANPQLKSVAWNDSKLGEHFGLIPTKKQADLSTLNDKEKKIYQAVCERYIAQFYPACEFKTASILIECEQEHFKSNGKIILVPGWKSVFQNFEEDNNNSDEEEQIFPNISENQNLLCSKSQKKDKKTAPPPRFTEGTLIKAMTNVHTLVNDPEQKKKLKEKKGIGQEATRTQILENLFKRLLLIRQGKQIISSEAGRALVKVLPKKIIDPALTAIWEDALDKISTGQLSSDSFKEKQKQWVVQVIEDVKKMPISDLKIQSQNSSSPTKSSSSSKITNKANSNSKKSKTCPSCGSGTLVERTAKSSGKKFLGCNQWPKCNYVEWPKK
jgi:DNA topoisomerase-3